MGIGANKITYVDEGHNKRLVIVGLGSLFGLATLITIANISTQDSPTETQLTSPPAAVIDNSATYNVHPVNMGDLAASGGHIPGTYDTTCSGQLSANTDANNVTLALQKAKELGLSGEFSFDTKIVNGKTYTTLLVQNGDPQELKENGYGFSMLTCD